MEEKSRSNVYVKHWRPSSINLRPQRRLVASSVERPRTVAVVSDPGQKAPAVLILLPRRLRQLVATRLPLLGMGTEATVCTGAGKPCYQLNSVGPGHHKSKAVHSSRESHSTADPAIGSAAGRRSCRWVETPYSKRSFSKAGWKGTCLVNGRVAGGRRLTCLRAPNLRRFRRLLRWSCTTAKGVLKWPGRAATAAIARAVGLASRRRLVCASFTSFLTSPLLLLLALLGILAAVGTAIGHVIA